MLIDSPIKRLPDAPHRLAPSEVLLDALSGNLAQPIAVVSRGAHIDGAAAGACVVLPNMRRNFTRPASCHKAGGIIGLVRAHGFGLATGCDVEHDECGRTFTPAVSMRDPRPHRQPPRCVRFSISTFPW